MPGGELWKLVARARLRRAGAPQSATSVLLRALLTYLSVSAVGNLLWEIGHLPLYTIWERGTTREKLVAVVHCTGGDLLIALSCLVASLTASVERAWPVRSHRRIAALTILLGLGYTTYSEWLNTTVRESWSYSDLMPVIPIVGVGISPFLQWIIVPVIALWCARRTALGVAARRAV